MYYLIDESKIFNILKNAIQYKLMGRKKYSSNRLSLDAIYRNLTLGECASIGKHTEVRNVTIGRRSYISTFCYFVDTEIGEFCSIGDYVSVIRAKHPSKVFVSTHPVFYSLGNQAGPSYSSEERFNEYAYADEEKHTSVIIGNDVWIGSYAKIMGGVTIGDGAIIGANALVTKDVPPYSIVGGVPAKIIRYRFEKEQIDFLQKYPWWEKNDDWLKQHCAEFENIDAFLSEGSLWN